MKADKLLDKFCGWALHEPTIKNEIRFAEEEFFAFHSQDKLHESETLQGLFMEWFLYDRKTTSTLKTPIQMFIEKRRKEFSTEEMKFFDALKRTVFGLFETLSSNPEKGLLHLKQFDTEKEWVVQDFNASQTISQKTFLFVRLIPWQEFSLLTGWLVGYTVDSAKFRESLSGLKRPLTPRDLLPLYAEKIRWEEKDADFCRNKLASLWQRWNPQGMTWKELENGIGRGDQSFLQAATKSLLVVLPNSSMMDDAIQLLSAFWNTFSGSAVGLKSPSEIFQDTPKGPKETMYMERMVKEFTQIFQREKRELTDDGIQKWLRDPSKGENGVSPFDLIYDERVAAGDPEPEKIGFHITVNPIKSISPEMEQASADYKRANEEMVSRNFSKAIELYESAYRLIQHDTDFAFRLLGNLGACYAFLGEREKAKEVLRASLKVNPQYDVARKRLSELEKMTSDEYKKFVRIGPSQMVDTPSSNQRTIKMVNRHAITIKWKSPFVKWVNSLRKIEKEPKLRVNDLNYSGTTYLVPEVDHQEDFQTTVKVVFPFIFEEELFGWSEDESAWPKIRTYTVFQQWFDVIYNDLVLDLAPETLETEKFE